MAKKNRWRNLYQLVMDYLKKCNDDHVGAFGAMSSFFLILSVFPVLIFLLSLTRYLPYSKEDLILILSNAISFENSSLIESIVNEIYRKTSTTMSFFLIVMALWSSSSGAYAIILGLNSVYDIEETRNYFVLRFVSILYTIVFAIIMSIMLVFWVFGNRIYDYFYEQATPLIQYGLDRMVHKRLIVALPLLTLVFMGIYHIIPNRKSKFLRQLPGALVATVGWMIVSYFYSVYVDRMDNFNFIYGSMTGVMILFLWLYFCMSMVFYGAEVNYFLENKRNYHMLVRILRPNWTKQRRQTEIQIRTGHALWEGPVSSKREKKKRTKRVKRENSEEFRRRIEKRVLERRKREQ